MRKLAALALLSLALGCKHPGSPKLEGRWKGLKADGVPESAQVHASAFALGTEIVAQGGKIMVQTPAGKEPAAAYFVDKEDATTLVIHTDPGGMTETFTFNDKADTMVWKLDAHRSMTFKKAAPP